MIEVTMDGRPVALRVTAIAAQARNRIIGASGQIPWKARGEQIRFRRATDGAIVVIGRKTCESLPGNLPNRHIIMLSRSAPAAGLEVRSTLHEAAERAAGLGRREILIAGGAQIYAHALPVTDVIYLSDVDAKPAGDALMHAIPDDFVEIWSRAVRTNVDFVYPHWFVPAPWSPPR